ncbi:hypothetical protein [Novosphingobium sp. JCM 18896]|uniref:hypothetical protein n=1 Tax=Novosphingobium sp. JCM 18896 TaxID=2989731 RepID=UPI002223C7CA|nr:hypothetical protein [Novosphingobium sp. JCM 18896]MCW1431321.1 hypothetical protein [Novosphingobium sp. JCM 18896]
MLGKLIAGIAGQQVAERLGSGNGAKGAAMGVLAATIARRLGPAGIIAALAGGYLLKKHSEKRQDAAVPPTYGAAPG